MTTAFIVTFCPVDDFHEYDRQFTQFKDALAFADMITADGGYASVYHGECYYEPATDTWELSF